MISHLREIKNKNYRIGDACVGCMSLILLTVGRHWLGGTKDNSSWSLLSNTYDIPSGYSDRISQ